MDFETKCYNKFSWGYVYAIGDKRYELWAESVNDLKMKVLARNLPWDDGKVPEAKQVRSVPMASTASDGSPASFRLPWCKSNYKRY